MDARFSFSIIEKNCCNNIIAIYILRVGKKKIENLKKRYKGNEYNFDTLWTIAHRTP